MPHYEVGGIRASFGTQRGRKYIPLALISGR